MSPSLVLEAVISGMLTGGIYALVAIGLTMIFGVMKIVNFAQAELLMLGMYAAFWWNDLLGADPYPSLLLVLPIFFLIGVAIQRYLIEPVLSAPEHNQILLTLGIGIFLKNLATFLFKPDFRSVVVPYGSHTITILGGSFTIVRLVAFGGAILLSALLYVFLQRTDIGRMLRASAEDRDAAVLMGVPVRKMYMLAFGLGTVAAGAAGVLVSPTLYVSPDVGSLFGVTSFVVIVLGGMGNFAGALVGGLLIGVSESVAALFMPPSMRSVVSYALFILVLWFRPQGLFGRAAS